MYKIHIVFKNGKVDIKKDLSPYMAHLLATKGMDNFQIDKILVIDDKESLEETYENINR